MLTIDIQTARRFILGKQGLWPGRRWRGIRGTQQAMRAMEYLQLDPLQIVARSHDIKLHGLDSKLDRTTDTFVILGLWLENKALGKNEAFAEAMARGFARFVTFLGARKMDAKAIREPLLRRRASTFIPWSLQA